MTGFGFQSRAERVRVRARRVLTTHVKNHGHLSYFASTIAFRGTLILSHGKNFLCIILLEAYFGQGRHDS